MKYGILADIHSNLEALLSVLGALEEKDVDELICLGDIVGYGADPSECLRIADERCGAAVCGNHDYAVSDDEILQRFNPEARAAAEWTRGQLGEGEKGLLKGLELKKSFDSFLIVHSTPLFPGEWGYIYTVEDAASNFGGFDESLCFIGHSHVPAVFSFYEQDSRCRLLREPVVFISPGMKYIINPGSVGQPRDGNPHAAFAVYDTGKREVELCRVPYDVERAGKKIIGAGLPGHLAMRLGFGL